MGTSFAPLRASEGVRKGLRGYVDRIVGRVIRNEETLHVSDEVSRKEMEKTPFVLCFA